MKRNPKEFDYMKAFIKCFESGTGTATVGAAHRSERERRTRGERVAIYAGEGAQCFLM